MSNGATPNALTPEQLDNIQGDLWSKGFPKNYEAYYFFSIVPGQEKAFSQCLKTLAPHISTLKKVSDDRHRLRETAPGEKKPSITNALIAFTFQGLQTIEKGLPGEDPLLLDDVEETDPTFFKGMTPGRKKTALFDPPRETWDPLFQSEKDIHGLLKVAANDKDTVDTKLQEFLQILQHGTVIKDIPGVSPPTEVNSRVDGWTRPKYRGKEHFGYEDGISQPRMAGIDDLEQETNDGDVTTNMNTPPHILLVTKDTHVENSEHKRPQWMYDGSFMVFRKLEQDVAGFEKLTDQWEEKNCESKDHMGAKLMGRWANGNPVPLPRERPAVPKQMNDEICTNDFSFGEDQKCPLSAHIRKSNLRMHVDFTDPQDERSRRTRIIRNGIPYGPDYDPNEAPGLKRGLLFACYQGQLEDGFVHLQARWSNNPDFPEPGTGHDPIVGQVPQVETGVNGNLTTYFTDKTHNHQQKQVVTFQQLVTLKGGSYFFVPSISALQSNLAGVEA